MSDDELQRCVHGMTDREECQRCREDEALDEFSTAVTTGMKRVKREERTADPDLEERLAELQRVRDLGQAGRSFYVG